ncbi:hypothetical protein SAMN03159341_12341 [Paenibacillus sp. 1_12]|uniref:hypothetical protein n=1 Tax=Paenibacillus sp. 1_12 TaxID=1566278 RepID=UPI0008E35D78|nr:hypothetical protein [Paenibacillus sp. 1_12]SFM27218.1 hypothetical protein SAMN03159341_12341 [Paenibacillus sp. 1_12]
MSDDDCKKKYKKYKKKYEDILNKQKQQHLQEQAQEQVQGLIDTDTISNVGNPIINMNVSAGGARTATPSAFRAFNFIQSIPVTTGPEVQVLFPEKEFDLNNEYDPALDAFIPKSDGIYSIIASIFFVPNDFNVDHYLGINIIVNDLDTLGGDDNFHGGGFNFVGNVVSCSIITKLKAGDRITVRAGASVSGNIEGPNISEFSRKDTSFSAARLA